MNFNQMKNCPIQDVKEFSLRTKSTLMMMGIMSTSNLSKLSAKDLGFIYGIGRKAQKSILEFCLKNNIRLSKESYYKCRKQL